MSKKSRPVVLFRVGILLLALLGALSLAEVILRLLPSRVLGFEYSEGRFRSPSEFTRDPTTNGLGFHDGPVPPRDARRPRVLLVGDSYVAALSVSIPETVGRRLEAHLESDLGRPVEVVALGQSGSGQRQQLAHLERLGAKLDPDWVVTLFLSLNDVRDNDPALKRESDQQLARMARFRPGWSRFGAERAPLFLIEGSRLNQLVSHRLGVLAASRRPDSVPIDYLVYQETPGAPWPRAWRSTEALLAQTRDVARSLGARYAIVSATTPHGVRGSEAGADWLTASYPALREIALDLDAPDRRVAEIADRLDVPFLALEPLAREGPGPALHWRYDGHWNAAGNDWAAAQIAAFLAELEESGSQR